MSQYEKIKKRIMRTPIPLDIKMDDLETFLSKEGFTMTYGKGDHRKFSHPSLSYHISIDFNKGNAKAYSIRDIQKAISEIHLEAENINEDEGDKMDYKVNIDILTTDDGYEWYAFYPEFPGVSGGGKTKAEALEIAERNLHDMIEYYHEIGKELPEPKHKINYSGKILFRTSKSLHETAACIAQEEGISLNQFVNEALAEKIGRKKALTDKNIVYRLDKIEKGIGNSDAKLFYNTYYNYLKQALSGVLKSQEQRNAHSHDISQKIEYVVHKAWDKQN